MRIISQVQPALGMQTPLKGRLAVRTQEPGAKHSAGPLTTPCGNMQRTRVCEHSPLTCVIRLQFHYGTGCTSPCTTPGTLRQGMNDGKWERAVSHVVCCSQAIPAVGRLEFTITASLPAAGHGEKRHVIAPPGSMTKPTVNFHDGLRDVVG